MLGLHVRYVLEAGESEAEAAMGEGQEEEDEELDEEEDELEEEDEEADAAAAGAATEGGPDYFPKFWEDPPTAFAAAKVGEGPAILWESPY